MEYIKKRKYQLERNATKQSLFREKKKNEFEQLKKKCEQLALQVEQLEESEQNLILENVQIKLDLEHQNQVNQINQTVFTNTAKLIQSLPHNSPYRRPLLFWFTKDLPMEVALNCYGISKRTYNRIVEQEDPEVVTRKYGIGVTRE